MLDDDTTTPTQDAPAAEGQDAVTAPAKKAAAKKTAAKKAPAKKAPAKKTAAKKAPAKKAAAAAEETLALDLPTEAPAPATRRRTTKKAAAEAPAAEVAEAAQAPADEAEAAPAKKTAAKKTPAKKAATKAPAKKTAAKKTAATKVAATETVEVAETAEVVDAPSGVGAPLFQAPEPTKAPARRTRKTAAQKRAEAEAAEAAAGTADVAAVEGEETPVAEVPAKKAAKKAPAKKTAAKKAPAKKAAAPAEDEALPLEEDEETAEELAAQADGEEPTESEDETEESSEDAEQAEGEDGAPARRRRRRGGRRRRKSGDSTGEGAGESGDAEAEGESEGAAESEGEGSGPEGEQGEGGSSSSRRRRRRRRAGEDGNEDSDDEPNTVTKVRKARSAEDQITAVSGSTRLEAKKQRRREGREAGRRRAPIVSEAEFLARRESVERVMAIRQRKDLTQIAVLEDKVLVEHYVARESQTSLIGNVYLGRVQNVLPSMEAAFIDIGKGRNAVLYAGEVNWQALGHKDGQPRKIESVLSSGQHVLVQVTKDPIGQKGARLTSQISLAGRFLVYVPDGTTSGISRKLPDTERHRLKTLLKEIVPDGAGVIVRTAAEGASEEELTRDVERLKARWDDIELKAKDKGATARLLYGEPDLTLKVVRDLFTEDFCKLVIDGDDAWETVHGYVEHVAPDLAERMERFEPATEGKAAGKDVFGAYRIEEQIHKGLDRKVWLPSGGSLIIDRTEAMTVVDVNTGKFTGSGGNLEETVTKNNLEAAEEIVRQLRLRDIGGIIVVDFIDMVLESNRDLVVRRLVECLGRDRTRHQVAEVTSLGLVQMTRKRIGTGLLEAFSENCEHCHGRGLVISDAPVEPRHGQSGDDEGRRGRRGRNRGRGNGGDNAQQGADGGVPSPKDVAAMARHDEPVDGAAAVKEMPPGGPAGEPSQPAAEVRAEESTEPDREELLADAAAPVKAMPAGEPGRRNRRSRSADQKPVETKEPAAPAEQVEPEVSEPEPAVEAAPEVVEATPVEEAPEQAVEEAPAEPAAPRVVTRTRRRAASRPAGQPEGGVALQPVVIEAVAKPEVVAEAAPEAAAPTVVTRTRGRAATRPAGPPAGEGEAGEAPAAELHVPVKKKGARKR
ncbi:MAG: Rne/Rng family ribonuclease [Nocardioides sp.]|uniref:Rne/Rng family ribonuclease n=1 Tax=Nocardioides sp. TaxID=35761 RepID=UPI003F128574